MKVALIGDSHSQALFPRLRDSLTQQGYEVISMVSKPGWGAKRFVDEGLAIVPAEAEGIVVSLGGNNHNLTSDYGRHIDDFIVSVGGAKRIVWVGPATSDASIAPSVAQRHEWTADYLKGALPSRGIKFIDSRPFTETAHREDGVHFTASGYDHWADSIQKPIMIGMAISPLVRQTGRIGGYTLLGLGALYGLYLLYGLVRKK